MATTTSRIGLTKPASTDIVDVSVLNTNFDKLDTAAGFTVCTSSTRPNVPYNGQCIIETDTLNQRIWLSASSTWILTSGTPVGAVIAVPKTTAPTGWLLCDGTVYSNTLYPDLAAYVGNTFGGVSGTSFAVPDLRGRTPIGVDGGAGRVTTNNALGNASGTQTHTLSTAEMPAHNHPVNRTYNILEQWAGSGAGGNSAAAVGPGPDSMKYNLANTLNTGYSTTNTGGGGAHNNMQPYLVLNYAIKL